MELFGMPVVISDDPDFPRNTIMLINTRNIFHEPLDDEMADLWNDEDAYPDDREERLEAWIDALDAGLLD